MQTLGKVLAGICAILLIITGVAALLAFNIERKAFVSRTYKQAFENQHLYERMPEVLGIALSNSIAQRQGNNGLLKLITPEQWSTTLTTILPPEELKALTNKVLDSTFDYLNGKTDAVVISLQPFKQYMTGPAGVEAVKQILATQPDCTSDQLTQMAFAALTGGDLILCNPPPQALQLMTPLIETQLQIVTSAFPDEATLFSSMDRDSTGDLRPRLNFIRLIMKLSPLLPFILLLVIPLFAVRTLTQLLTWWGWPLLVAGMASLLTALFGSPALAWIIQKLIQRQGTGFLQPILSKAIAETAGEITRQMLRPVVIEGAVLAGLGLGMILITVFMKKKGNDEIIQRMENPNV